MLKGVRLRVGLKIFLVGVQAANPREPLNFRVFHHVKIAILRGSVHTIFKV